MTAGVDTETLRMDVKEANAAVLVRMWRSATADAAQCAVSFHLPLGVAQLMAGMTLDQLLQAATGEFMFTPKFDEAKLARFCGLGNGPALTAPDIELLTMVSK